MTEGYVHDVFFVAVELSLGDTFERRQLSFAAVLTSAGDEPVATVGALIPLDQQKLAIPYEDKVQGRKGEVFEAQQVDGKVESTDQQ
jgi:hypothetical protein